MATKTRRKEVETVRTYRSEESPLTESEPTGWSRLLPWSRARARNRYATRLRETLARIEVPEVKAPDVKAPDMRLPDVNLSVVKLPELTMRDVRDAAEWPRRAWQRRQRARRTAEWTGRGIGAGTVLLAGFAGAAAAYFFDPDRGRGRRIQAADRFGAFARKTGDDVGRVARYVSATVNARAQAWMRPRSEYVAPNDAALKAKVESELFADPSIDKGRISINVENGVVVLRGTADSEDQIGRIVGAARGISGVLNVRDILRVPAQAMTGVVASPESTPNGWTATDTGETSAEYGSDQPA